jgi:hypothetical protein
MSAHQSPEQIRSQLKHPVVDGDGHWLEYAPVFSEKMRKAAGDKSAEGFLAALRSTTDALKMTPEERRQRRVAMPNFWNRQAENTLDRATAMMPKMLYERLDEIGLDFAIVYPTAGLRLPRIKDDETCRAVIRGYNIVSAEYFSGLEDRLPGRDHPDAPPEGGDRRARIRHKAARLEGRHVRQRHVAADRGDRGQRPGIAALHSVL